MLQEHSSCNNTEVRMHWMHLHVMKNETWTWKLVCCKRISMQQNVSRSFPSKNQRGLFTISGEKALTGVGYLVDKNSQQECLNVRKLVEGCREAILYWKILPSLVWALGLCHTWRFVCHQAQSALPGTGNQTFLWEGDVKTLWNHGEDNTSLNTQLSGAVVW